VTVQNIPLDLLRCPVSGAALVEADGGLAATDAVGTVYAITGSGIPLFAKELLSNEGRTQEAHYDHVAQSYLANLRYPHTLEYTAYLDAALLKVVERSHLGTVAEICCGRGEAFGLLGGEIGRGVGVDISVSMLEAALHEHRSPNLCFVQGDATILPLASNSFDSVFMLGGIHHVNDRNRLFGEISRVLRPGGMFYFREPVSDFALWRWIRAVIYRVSPALDSETERPLRNSDTVPVLEEAGLKPIAWRTHGFLGFCVFMNSDVLVFNRFFRFLPGIRVLTRYSARVDEWILHLPGLGRAGLQVVGVAQKESR
jgi:SAM-dependent methyltransferase